jgi:hypothetical protein
MSGDLVERIDKALSFDFHVMNISEADKENKYYLAMKEMLLNTFQTKTLYERRVVSSNAILPKIQYLFGFKPRDSLCLILNKPMHKVVCCNGDLAKLNNNCFLVNGLQFLLQEGSNDRAWCYVPQCLCDSNQGCELRPHANQLRIRLWEDKPST